MLYIKTQSKENDIIKWKQTLGLGQWNWVYQGEKQMRKNGWTGISLGQWGRKLLVLAGSDGTVIFHAKSIHTNTIINHFISVIFFFLYHTWQCSRAIHKCSRDHAVLGIKFSPSTRKACIQSLEPSHLNLKKINFIKIKKSHEKTAGIAITFLGKLRNLSIYEHL